MSGFSKRPKSKGASKPAPAAKKLSAEKVQEEEFIDDDDYGYDDDIPVRNSKKSRSTGKSTGKTSSGGKKNKPNIFVRAARAIFPCKGDGIAESVRKVIFDIAVVAFVVTGGTVVKQLIDEAWQSGVVDQGIVDSYKDDKEKPPEVIRGELNLKEEEIEAIEQEKPGISYSFMELYNQNSDVIGWIRLGDSDNPVINYPVVQAADNKYYLTKNFLKQDSERGTIYADYRNVITQNDTSGNIILYGHNMWNGETMFAKLTRYYDGRLHGESQDRLGFYKKYPTLTFNTLYENSEWKVFACVLFNTQENLGEVYPYNNVLEFGNKNEFNSFILDLMDRSVLWTDVDLTYGDTILTLSTCYYPYGKENADTRCAVFARKVRDGESPEVDVSKAQVNNSPLKFAYQYQQEGGSWTGRSWDTSKLLSYGE